MKTVGTRLVLRPYRLADALVLRRSQEGRLRRRLTKYDGVIPTAAEPDARKRRDRLMRQRQSAKKGRHFIFAAFNKKTGAFIGQIDIFTLNEQLRWGNIGYHIQNQFFGQGYATEAVRLGLRLAFRELGYHRLEAAMELDNKPSRRVAEKAGMTYEGIRRKFFPESGGIDMLVYASNAIDHTRRTK